jgi:hypothetical protein
MFGPLLIGLLAALSAGAWVYTKVMRRTGNNSEQSLVTAGLAAGAVFIIFATVAWTIDSML